VTTAADPSILADVAAYYAAKLETHGSTPQGIDWHGIASHETRHLLRMLEANPEANSPCWFGKRMPLYR
jgi:hypothetical protein